MKTELIEEFNLSEEEAARFLALLQKIKYSQEDADYVNHQLEDLFPFMGGMSAREALIMLCERMKESNL